MNKYTDALRDDLTQYLLTHGHVVEASKDWYYGSLTSFAQNKHYAACGGVATKKSQLTEEHYMSFAGTFAESDTPSIMITLDKVSCKCGSNKNLLLGVETTLGELMQSLLGLDDIIKVNY